MKIDVAIFRIIFRPLLWLTKFFNDEKAVVVCKGYGDDWNYYTGLCWEEDKNIDFSEYSNFRLWLNF
jgi:hypothetical protein